MIRKVLVRAFEILRGHDDCPIEGAAEDDITSALRDVIENRLRRTGEVDGFNRSTFGFVERQHRVVTHDGASIKKEPDMCFRLQDDGRLAVISTEDGLVVECKPVDRRHPVRSAYCDAGMARFVNGEYAWAMQEAMMVAYVRDGRTIDRHLARTMDAPETRTKLAVLDMPRPIGGPGASADDKAEPLHQSRHERNFVWRDGKGQATPIVLYHSWHRCD